MIPIFYIAAIIMGIFVALFTAAYVKAAMKAPRGPKRNIYVILHPVFTVIFVLISSMLIKKYFCGLRGVVNLNVFYLIWIFPYSVVVIAMIKKYRRR